MNLNNLLRGLLFVLILAFASLIAWSMRDNSARIGAKAPAFSIVTDQGKHITPTSFGGKVLVLNFWATWCSTCLEELPSLNEFQQEFANSGVVVVGVSIDKKEQKYHDFLRRIPLSFDTSWDPQADVSGEYGTFQYPESYVIKDGVVVHKYDNAENWMSPEIQQYVHSLL